MSDAVTTLVRFGHALRDEGIPVGPAQARTFCEAAAVLGLDDLYWAGRASLTWRPEHVSIYDEAFRRFFSPARAPAPEPDDAPQSSAAAWRARATQSGAAEAGSSERTASANEVLHEKSFVRCTEEDWLDLAELMADLPPLLPRRRRRRYRRGRPGSPDVRRLLRKAAATGGEPFELRERRRRHETRPLIFLLDVSGSMAAYTRGLLLFVHAVARRNAQTSAFAFGTQLTDITAAISLPTFDNVLAAGEPLVPDWDGGTRIGEAIAAFLALRARRAVTRRSIVFVCSDGLDTGDPDLLADQIVRLRRTVHRLVWLNPLKESPEYEPLARGMVTALPHVDRFESGHSVAALLSVLQHVDGPAP